MGNSHLTERQHAALDAAADAFSSANPYLGLIESGEIDRAMARGLRSHELRDLEVQTMLQRSYRSRRKGVRDDVRRTLDGWNRCQREALERLRSSD